MKALIDSEKKDGVDSIHLADYNPIILAVRLIAQIVLWIESFKVIYSITSQCKWCSVEEGGKRYCMKCITYTQWANNKHR